MLSYSLQVISRSSNETKYFTKDPMVEVELLKLELLRSSSPSSGLLAECIRVLTEFLLQEKSESSHFCLDLNLVGALKKCVCDPLTPKPCNTSNYHAEIYGYIDREFFIEIEIANRT
jgi:hypothetical protein